MTDDSAGSAKKRPRTHRSRITNGSKLLPSVHPQSTWARVYRDTLDTLHSHLGGEDFASAPQLMHARYAAVLDTELILTRPTRLAPPGTTAKSLSLHCSICSAGWSMHHGASAKRLAGNARRAMSP